MLAWFPSAQPTVIPFYVSRHQQKIPWLVSSPIIWPLITTTDQSETIPFVRSGYFSPLRRSTAALRSTRDQSVPVVPDVQSLRSVHQGISPFQPFQSFNRFAPFKTFPE